MNCSTSVDIPSHKKASTFIRQSCEGKPSITSVTYKTGTALRTSDISNNSSDDQLSSDLKAVQKRSMSVQMAKKCAR